MCEKKICKRIKFFVHVRVIQTVVFGSEDFLVKRCE